MPNTMIKADRVTRTALGLLERQVVLPRLVWRDAAGDFRGARGDAITIRLPAYFKARTRALRSAATRTKDALTERRVVVTLDTDVYGVIPITDEEVTLDIERFNEQVTVPVLGGVARTIEESLVSEIQSAPYHEAHVITLDTDRPYNTIVDARQLLNDARVPLDGRSVICGSEVESILLKDDLFVRADQSGSTEALREANVGRVARMPVYAIPALDPDEAYVVHRTAFVLSSRAPFVPQGAPWGATESWEGFAIRTVMAIDPDEVVDNFHADAWIGTNYVPDYGAFNQKGQFEPAVDVDEDHDEPVFVRAVKIELGS